MTPAPLDPLDDARSDEGSGRPAPDDRVIYARYSSVEDQALAGVIMWVPGSIPLLRPILRVIVELSSARVAIEGRHA